MGTITYSNENKTARKKLDYDEHISDGTGGGSTPTDKTEVVKKLRWSKRIINWLLGR